MREHINDAEVENVLSAIRKLIVEGRPEPQREQPPSPFLLTPALRVGGEGAPAPLEPLVLSAPIVVPAAAPPTPQPIPRASDADRESAVPLQGSAKPEAALSLDPPVAAAPAPVIQASWSNLVTLAQADARREAVRKAEAAAAVNDAAPASPTDTSEPTPPVTRLDDAALPITTSERPASQAHDTLVLHPAPEAASTTQPTPDAPPTGDLATPSVDTTTGATIDHPTDVPDAPTTGTPDDLATTDPEPATTGTTDDYAGPDAALPTAIDDLATSATTGAPNDAAPSVLQAPTAKVTDDHATVAPDAVTADEPTPHSAETTSPEDPDPTPADLATASLPKPASADLAPPEPEPRAEQPEPVASDLPLPDQSTLRNLIREILHEELSRDIVAEVVRTELRGDLGETITRNLRKIVKQELLQALASREGA